MAKMRSIRVAVACVLLVLIPSQVQAAPAPLWFNWQGVTILDRKYAGKKLAVPVPRAGIYGVRYKGLKSENSIDVARKECYLKFLGKQFTYVLPINGWLCYDTIKP
jgi:hypothetical protein